MHLLGVLSSFEDQLYAVCVLRAAGLGDEPLANADDGGHGLTQGWEGPRSRCIAHERVSQRRECLAVEAAAARGCVE